MRLRHFFGIIAVVVVLMGTGCNMDYRSKEDGGGSSSSEALYKKLASIKYIQSSDIDVKAELNTDKNDDNVLTLSRDSKEYIYYKITKRGTTDDEDEADSSGTNAAVRVSGSGTLTLKDSLIVTSGDHAHGVFSLNEGTSAVVSECVVSTKGTNSSGIMTSDGGTARIYHATSETSGRSSPALHVRRKGGFISAELGHYTTSGTNSPVILSAGEISVSGAKLEAKSSSVVAAEGKSSVTLTGCEVSSGSDTVPAVMMYMEGGGNPVLNAGTFTISGGEVNPGGGGIFYVSNAAADITVTETEIYGENGVLLRAEASERGTAGVNGGHVNLKLVNQTVNGNIYADDISDVNLYLVENAYFQGAVNSANTDARIYVSVFDAKWILTGDSYIDSLTCEENSIILNGHTLYVDGTAYEAGTTSTGSEIDFDAARSKPAAENSGDPDTGGDSDTDSESDTGTDTDDRSSDTTTPAVDTDTDTENTASGDAQLSFDASYHDTGTVNGVAYRVYSDITYVMNPVNEEYQKMSIYIPEAYIGGGTLNGYTASTAPIFIPNNSGGYMAASIMAPGDTNIAGLALSHGLVVVSPALRGRNVNDGTAPASVVDYKAAIRYIRANKDRLPAGNTDRIIACGVSSGGALSAVLGASGNSQDYDSWLEEIGAASDVSDDIFAAVSYCPVTNLENADGAYEWIFGGEKYGEESVELAEDFENYVNTLGLKSGDTALEIDESYSEEESPEGWGFRRYIEGLYADAAQKALSSGTTISTDWVYVSGDKVISTDINAYADSFKVRQKGVPAFDKFDLSSAENSEFNYMHFTQYSYAKTVVDGEIADWTIIDAMNPMNYIGKADTCKYWRIRHGVNDRDITVTIPAILALALENSGITVDFAAVWGQGHAGYYDTEELFGWIDSICK